MVTICLNNWSAASNLKAMTTLLPSTRPSWRPEPKPVVAKNFPFLAAIGMEKVLQPAGSVVSRESSIVRVAEADCTKLGAKPFSTVNVSV